MNCFVNTVDLKVAGISCPRMSCRCKSEELSPGEYGTSRITFSRLFIGVTLSWLIPVILRMQGNPLANRILSGAAAEADMTRRTKK